LRRVFSNLTCFSPESLKRRARDLKCDLSAPCLARNDPRIPSHAKAVIVVTVAYALSPIDLIPDFIPVLGYLNYLIIVPTGIAFAVSRIPPGLLEEYRERAGTKFLNTPGIRITILIRLIMLSVVLKFVFRLM
jgi:uncharacterized membrane protein YkvA (DUF1232 family)